MNKTATYRPTQSYYCYGDPIRKTNGDIAKNNQNREPIRIVQQNNYDAWGLDFSTNQTPPSGAGGPDRYQYNSKERIQDLGIEMYDFGTRHYDAAVGRWSMVDPLAEKYFNWSPYNYVLGNPLRFVDPDGKSPDDDYKLKRNGEIVLSKRTKDNFDRLQSTKNPDKELIVQKGAFDFKYDKNSTEMSSKAEENFIFSDRTTAEEVFEIAAENSDVEFAKIDVERSGQEFSIVRTDQDKNSVHATSFANELIAQNPGINVTKIDHSHNNGSGPSGFSSPNGDRVNAETFSKAHGNSTIFRVYNARNQKYIRYDGDKIY